MKDSARGGVIFVVIIVSLILYFVIWMPGCDTGSGGGVMVQGQPAPDFSTVTLDGENISLSDFKGDKPVIIDLFATWCGPCIMEFPIIQEYYEEHSDEMIIIAISNEPENMSGAIEAIVEENGITFPVIHDIDGSITRLYPTNAIPFLVFIDKDGVVIYTKTGADPYIGKTIDSKFGL